ncbi:MAG: MmgE/PrpD family protein [Geminicoccaceae bacterium]
MEAGGTQARAIATGQEALAAWASGLRWQDIPRSIRGHAALVLADDLAAIIAARDEPEIVALQNGLAASSGPAEATVFNGRGQRFDRYSAAIANGSAADWCELDEGYRRVICHAGLYCVPALLAEAEATGAKGEDLLRALVIGYEVASRVARTFTFEQLTLHPHGSLAAVGAAAAVAALRRLPVATLASSISSAATMVMPAPYNHAIQGALVRNVWPGVGGAIGLRAADWATIGIAGRPESLYDVYAGAFGADVDPAELTDGLGASWALSDGYHKIHACCQYAHSAVEASLALMEQLPPGWSTGSLKQIRIETHRYGLTLDNLHPRTTLAAKFSMQHILAATAAFGHAGAAAFYAHTLHDPDIATLRQAVEITAFEPQPEWPNDRPARVTWAFEDGTMLSEVCLSARGGPDRPFQAAEIEAKVVGIVDTVYPRMGGWLVPIMRLDQAGLDATWGSTVARMTEG